MTVEVDGLDVRLSGAAPDETSRFRAQEIARQIVDARRIADATTLPAAKPLPAPPFALELLRNEAEVSLIGLVPETGGRDVIRSALGAGGLNENVTDMLEASSEPPPEGWREALGFGLSVLAELPRAKISVAPGKVKVIAVADSDPDREKLEQRLKRAAPDGVALALDISAPAAGDRALRLRLQPAGRHRDAGRLQRREQRGGDRDPRGGACRGAGRRRRLRGRPRLALAGLDGGGDARARGAAGRSGGGRFALSDIAAELTAPEGTTADRLTEVSSTLDAALPDVFQLTTVMPPRMETARRRGAGLRPALRGRSCSTDGSVRLSGSVHDTTSQEAIESYAAALFGHDRVMDTTMIDPRLPEGWPGRVLAGVEALAALKEGKLQVTPEQVSVAGWGIERDVDSRVEALLAREGRQGGRGRRHLQRRGRGGSRGRGAAAARDLRRPDQRHPRGRLDPVRRRVRRHRAREPRGDRRDRRRAARLPRGGVRDRRPHRRAGRRRQRTSS